MALSLKVIQLMTIRRDAEDTKFVYEWRLEQEASLRSKKGDGMTDEQVRKFVDGCGCTSL